MQCIHDSFDSEVLKIILGSFGVLTIFDNLQLYVEKMAGHRAKRSEI